MAAPFQNYSGGVLLADIVKRNNLSTYVAEAIKERSQFIKSGAVVRNALLDALVEKRRCLELGGPAPCTRRCLRYLFRNAKHSDVLCRLLI